MKKRSLALILTPVAFAVLLTGCTHAGKSDTRNAVPAIPDLDKISGEWVKADTIAMEPSLRNFRGEAVLNRDLTSISWFASAPYSGGYHTGVFKINGEIPMTEYFRWEPYQSLRKTTWKNTGLLSSTRWLPEEDGMLWKIDLKNNGSKADTLHLSLDAIGFISKYGGDWQWWYPYPKMNGQVTKRDDETETVRKNIGRAVSSREIMIEEMIEGKPTGKLVKVTYPSDPEILNCAKYTASSPDKNKIIVNDTETSAVTGFSFLTPPDAITTYKSGGTATWDLVLAPGETKTLEYVMTYSDNAATVTKNLTDWSTSFSEKFDRVRAVWDERWHQLFEPSNNFVTGSFPTLETTDTISSRVYYTGPLTMLYLMNTNLPAQKRVIMTGGPKWGATISFFWDNTEWSTMQAVVDPGQLKQSITSWMKIDPSRFYGVDNFGGKGVGNAYSANYWALFQLIRSYLAVTGDTAFLQEKVDGKSVLETLEHYATNGQRMSNFGKPGFTDDVYKLADFGSDEWNLLECVPTYKQIVPSFNAGYIWMLRETAALYAQSGNTKKADQLTAEATELKTQLLKLYAGNGVWNCVYPDGKKIEVRHCLDFMFLGRYMPHDVPEKMREEMMAFLYRELMTDHWMRAQSVSDVAAKNSDRPDHGPLGAYDGWPAGTMDALSQLGFPGKALDFFRSIEPVTREGTWAQAHELWGDNKNNAHARVRIAERGWHARDAMAGVGMSQVMLKCFFGFNPAINGPMIVDPNLPGFDGKLLHVKYKGEYFTLIRKDGHVTSEKE